MSEFRVDEGKKNAKKFALTWLSVNCNDDEL